MAREINMRGQEIEITDFFPLIQKEKLESDEELYFVWWLIDLYKAGYVKNALHEPTTFNLSEPVVKPFRKETQLKTKLKVEEGEETVLDGLVYTPDFAVQWTEKAIGIFCDHLHCVEKLTYKRNPLRYVGQARGLDMWTYVEVKPEHDHKNMTRAAKIKMNWTYQKHGAFINLQKVGKALFKKTFTPDRFRFTNKKLDARKLDYKPRTLEEFISTL